MPEEIDVACPGCNAIFGVPLEYCGETGECAECGTMFEIPRIDSPGMGKFTATETGAIKGVESGDIGDTTSTVRLSRTGIGMIPQVKDRFQFGEPPAPARPSPGPSPSRTFTKPASPSTPPSAPRAPAPASAPSAPADPAAPAATAAAESPSAPAPDLSALPAWANVRLKKGEGLVGVRESAGSPTGTAVLASVPIIIAGAAGIASDMIGMPVAAGIVGVICVAVFVAAMLMGKKSSRKALVVTNQRAISVVGNDRLEVKQ